MMQPPFHFSAKVKLPDDHHLRHPTGQPRGMPRAIVAAPSIHATHTCARKGPRLLNSGGSQKGAGLFIVGVGLDEGSLLHPGPEIAGGSVSAPPATLLQAESGWDSSLPCNSLRGLTSSSA